MSILENVATIHEDAVVDGIELRNYFLRNKIFFLHDRTMTKRSADSDVQKINEKTRPTDLSNSKNRTHI
jgi:hypothetical protein